MKGDRMNRFVLASKSPRRREILENIGLEFEILVSSADEDKIARNIPPEMLVSQLALLKATAVADEISDRDTFIIGADTVVCLDGKILEKPVDEADARRMLTELSGRTHSVFTGVCIFDKNSGKAVSGYQKTDVKFKELSVEKIDAYVKTGEPMDKAGSYGIQEKGALLIDEIHGDYFNVVGLPVALLADMFYDEFGVKIW